MRRLSVAGLVAVVLGAGLVAVLSSSSSEASDTFTIDAIFDNAAFVTPGSDVRIAGANVGKVESVSLTTSRKARLRLTVQRRFAPFRSDADCTIQPQSLIGEKFVQCTPGTPGHASLGPAADGGVPEIPLANTHTPVDLDLVLGTFSQPTPARLSMLLDALGNGLSGRGGDLNEALRRANPALQQTGRLMRQLAAERDTIRALTTEADRVVGSLAERREAVATFVRDSGRLLATTAGRRTELRQTLRGIPPVLDQARPALQALDGVATRALPVLSALDRSAAPLTGVVDRVAPFAAQVRPTLPALTQAAAAGRRTARQAAPQLRRVARLAGLTPSIAANADAFLSSSEDRGGVDGVLHFVYYGAAALARYDSTAHILPAFPLVAGLCNVFATTTVPQCDAHFAAGRVAARRTSGAAVGKRAPSRPVPSADPAPEAKSDAGPTGVAAPTSPTEVLGDVLGKVGGTTGAAVDDAVSNVLGTVLGRPSRPQAQRDDQPVRALLDYLLGGGA